MRTKGRTFWAPPFSESSLGDSTANGPAWLFMLKTPSLLTDAMLPGHFGLFLLGGEQRLGDLARHGSWNRPEVLLRDAAFSQVWFWRKCRGLVVMVMGVCDVYSVGMVVVAVRRKPWRNDHRSRMAAAGGRLQIVQHLRLGDAVANGEVGRLGLFRVHGPSLAGGPRVQCVGPCWRLRGGLDKVALAQGGDAAAGTAGQGGVTTIQARLWTGGRGRYRVKGRLAGERETQFKRQNYI